LDTQEYESEYEQEKVDWNLEHRVDNIISSLEVFNAHDFAKDYIPLIEREGASLAPDPFHDKHKTDCFMYSFVDSQKDEFANHLVEEQVDVPSFFLLDDIAEVVDFPIYDEYDDDYDVDFLEQLVVCSLSENVPFQQCKENNQPTYHSYKEESIESTEGNSLPLCFSSFKLLKENSKIIIEAKECVLMPNHTNSLEKIDKKLQQSSHVFDDPVTCYVEGLVSTKLQPLVEDVSENECVQQSKEIEKCAYDSSEENEEVLNQVKEPFHCVLLLSNC
jgi:hypothetical protein